jgi:hypothetical protein
MVSNEWTERRWMVSSGSFSLALLGLICLLSGCGTSTNTHPPPFQPLFNDLSLRRPYHLRFGW